MFYGGLQNDKLQRTNRKYYSADGSMEIKTNPGGIEFVTYIGGDGYSAPVVYKKAYNVYTTIPDQMLYLHRDYQGSILAITNDAGAVLEKRLFDAWGSLIQYWNIGGITTPPAESLGLVLDRGYTGHEHLQSVGLINMNGRLYDPKLHRFLQPDNNIQDPYNTQNYNRYGYVLNNPLKFTDPTGEDYIDNHDGRLGGPCLSCPPPVPAGYQGSAESWNSGWSIDRVGIGGSSVPGGANGFGGSGYYNGGSFIRGNVSLPDFVPPKGAIQLKEVIVYGKPRRKSSSAQGNGGGQGGGVNAIDLVDYGVGGLGEAKNLMSYLWKSSSNASQWRAAYQASKTLGVGASVLKNGVSPALSKIGRNLTYAAVAVTAVKVISTGQVHASDVLALSMTALGATGFGVPIATAFFAADLLTLAITGQSIGNHLDKVVGQPLIDFGYGRN